MSLKRSDAIPYGVVLGLACCVGLAYVEAKRWEAAFQAEQRHEVAENSKTMDRPRSDLELLAAARALLPSNTNPNDPAPFHAAHVTLQELMRRFPGSAHFAEAKALDDQVSRIADQIDDIAVLTAAVEARNREAFAKDSEEYRAVVGDSNIQELQHRLDSFAGVPEADKIVDFPIFHRLFYTSLADFDAYAVSAVYDGDGNELCDKTDFRGGCAAHALLLAGLPADVSARQHLYDLRGQQGCFVVMKADDRIVVKDGFGGSCDPDALQGFLHVYEAQLKVDNMIVAGPSQAIVAPRVSSAP